MGDENAQRSLFYVMFSMPYDKDVVIGCKNRVIYTTQAKSYQAVTEGVLWPTHQQSVARYLKKLCFLSHIGETFPWCYKKNATWATLQKCSSCVTREMLFGSYGRCAPLVLQKKLDFGHMQRCYMLAASLNTFCTWQIYCRHVDVNQKCPLSVFAVLKSDVGVSLAILLQQSCNRSYEIGVLLNVWCLLFDYFPNVVSNESLYS